VQCPKCFNSLPAAIFSKTKQKKRDFRCDICRAIDVQESVQACWDRDDDYDDVGYSSGCSF